jgi:hypothetical protein
MCPEREWRPRFLDGRWPEWRLMQLVKLSVERSFVLPEQEIHNLHGLTISGDELGFVWKGDPKVFMFGHKPSRAQPDL